MKEKLVDKITEHAGVGYSECRNVIEKLISYCNKKELRELAVFYETTRGLSEIELNNISETFEKFGEVYHLIDIASDEQEFLEEYRKKLKQSSFVKIKVDDNSRILKINYSEGLWNYINFIFQFSKKCDEVSCLTEIFLKLNEKKIVGLIKELTESKINNLNEASDLEVYFIKEYNSAYLGFYDKDGVYVVIKVSYDKEFL